MRMNLGAKATEKSRETLRANLTKKRGAGRKSMWHVKLTTNFQKT